MKILIVDDSQVFVMGLRLALKSFADVTEILEAGTVPEALSRLKANPDIDVAVVDVSIEQENDGLGLVASIKESFPSTRILVLSQYKNPYFIYKSISSGAKAYLAKDSAPEVIVKAIRDVVDGNCMFFGDTISPELLSGLFGAPDRKSYDKPNLLTSKELSVLQFITSGYSNSQIASAMDISSNTVESYKERIKSKFGYDTIIECVACALHKGLVEFRG